MQANVWRSLGMIDVRFWPDRVPEIKGRMADMAIRDEQSGKATPDPDGPPVPGGIDCFGGHGASASMPDYFKILQSLLIDDEKLLKRSTTAQMFQPQLTKEAREEQKRVMTNPVETSLFVGEFPKHVPMDHGLGGILTTEADKGWRGKHTMMWSGLPNLFWVRLNNIHHPP